MNLRQVKQVLFLATGALQLSLCRHILGQVSETPTKWDVFALTRMNIYMLPKQVARKH